MKGDFSRLPSPRGGPYSGVWMQQGRVQLDQDWNEQLALEAERSRAALRDLVGADGAPAADPGFEVRARGGVHCGGRTVFEAELDVDFPGGELTVEVRVVLEEHEDGGVLVEVDGWFALWIDGEGRPVFHVGGKDAASIVSPEALPRGAPVLVSAAYDGRVAVLHLDGRPVAALAVQAEAGPSRGRLRIGGSSRGAGSSDASGDEDGGSRVSSEFADFSAWLGSVTAGGSGGSAGIAGSGGFAGSTGSGGSGGFAGSGGSTASAGSSGIGGYSGSGGSTGSAGAGSGDSAGSTGFGGSPGSGGSTASTRSGGSTGSMRASRAAGAGGEATDFESADEEASAASLGAVASGFGGAMDEVRLWRHARTPAQLRDTSSRTLTGREDGLAAYYPLNEGHGAVAHDAAGGRHARARREPRWNPHELMLGSGRMYVDGVPCVSPREVSLDEQPDLPGGQPLAAGRHLVYLDVWERYLSAAEDPHLREVALAGLDTTGRTRTVWQARTQPLGEREAWRDALAALQRRRLRSAMAARRVPEDSPAPGNRLYRVEIHGSGGLYGWPRPPADTERAAHVRRAQALDGGGWTLTVRGAEPELFVVGARVELFTLTDKQAGPTAHVTAADAQKNTITVDQLPSGFSGWKSPRVRAVATFLWSADNAWRAWPVEFLVPKTGVAHLGDVGPEGVTLRPGDLVELTDERTVLLAQPGLPLQVKSVDSHTETVTLSLPVAWPPAPGGGRTLLRQWSRRDKAPYDAAPVRADEWTPLDDGVEVRFEGTSFRAGDYWTVPMRVAVPGGLEWPVVESGGAGTTRTRPAAVPPQGIEHRYAALATVDVHPHKHHAGKHRIEVQDHRRVFEPLVTLTREAKEKPPEHHHHHHHHHDHHHEHGHHHHHEHAHGEDVDVVVQAGDARVEVDVDEAHGRETVDVRVDSPDGADVRVVVHEDDGPHRHHHHRHRDSEDAGASTDADGSAESDESGDEDGSTESDGSTDGDGSAEAGESTESGFGGYGWRDEPRVDVDVDLHGHGDDVHVEVDEHGGEIDVDVHTRGPRGEDEDVRVVVHAPGVPAGFWVFGETRMAPDGFASTGARLTLPEAAPAWTQDVPLPGARSPRVRCAVLGERIYAFCDGSREVLRFDPTFGGEWVPETGIPAAWRGYAVAALNGRIHLVGGRDARNHVIDWHRAYDPATGEWSRHAPLPSPRCDVGAASLNGALYAAGGTRSLLGLTTAAVDAYDPNADAWTGVRRMHHARANPGIVAAAGRLYVVGGRQPGMGRGRPVEATESFDPVRGRWKELEPVTTPCLDAALAELDGVLYFVGGDAGAGPTGLTQACSLRGGGWVVGPELEIARTGLGLAAHAGRLYAVGGGNGELATDSVEVCRLFFDLHGFVKQ